MPDKPVKGFLVHLRNYFTTGLFILAPTAVSVMVLVWVFRWFDNILGQWYTRLFEVLNLPVTHITGLGAITLAILVTFIGFMARLYIGRKLISIWNKFVIRVPLVNRIYPAVQQISDAFAKDGNIVFNRPVLLEYPRLGLYSIGFVTRDWRGPFCDLIGKEVSSVFIPTTPNPTSGVVLFVPRESLIPLEMSIEDAMKFIISAGMITGDIRLSEQGTQAVTE